MLERKNYYIEQHDGAIKVTFPDVAETTNLAICTGIGFLSKTGNNRENTGYLRHFPQEDDELLREIAQYVEWVIRDARVPIAGMDVGVSGRLKWTKKGWEENFDDGGEGLSQENARMNEIDRRIIALLIKKGCSRDRLVHCLSEKASDTAFSMQVDCFGGHILIHEDDPRQDIVKVFAPVLPRKCSGRKRLS